MPGIGSLLVLDECPHCATRSVQARVTNVDQFQESNPFDAWVTVRCSNCGRLTLMLESGQSRGIVYPGLAPHRDYRDDIPDEVVDDYNEAGACLGAGAYKASMVMSRRALQRLLKQQDHKEKRLVAAIDAAKSAGTIHPRYHALADEIREYGNLGAHPDDDQLANANAENARHIIDFCDLLIADIYDLRARAESLRKQRTGGSGTEGDG